ncbi:MAG TPA: protein arginine kinase [Rhabdochlamydiaceae bacterium]|nr:protein arginine kinase [Rhabdochlamydiaceae bacterium]
MNQKADLARAILENIPWKTTSNPIWPFTLFILRRNLAKYHFPSKMNEAEAAAVLDSLKNVISNLPEMANGYLLKKQDLKPLDKELLLEHFLFTRLLPESAHGSALLLNPSVAVLSTINMGNHLELFHILDSTGDLDSGWNLISKIENTLGSHFDFAFSSKFGFLTSDPNDCGTGLSVLAFLHLPALIQTGQLQEIWAKQNDESLIFTGISGDPNDLIGDMIVLQNHFTLGVTEESIIRSIQTMASKLVASEKKARSTLKKEAPPKIKDKISKAYGQLIYAYELEVKETLNLLSLIRLGLDLGWITAVQENKINELFFKTRRGYLTHLFPGTEDLKEIAHKRAEYLHSELQGIQLAI